MSAYSSATVVTAGDSIELSQRKALKSALYAAKMDRREALRKQFNIAPAEAPSTMTDIIAAIVAGKFSIKPGHETSGLYEFAYAIDWRDPSQKEDQVGYVAAKTALSKEYDDLELRIAIIPVADALTAVEAFRDAK